MKDRKNLLKWVLSIVLLVSVVFTTPVNARANSNDETDWLVSYAMACYEKGMTLDEIRLDLLESVGDEKLVDEALSKAAEVSGNDFFNPASSAKGGSISKMTFQSIEKQEYTGKAIKPSVTIKDGNYKLVKGTDYTVTYSNNKEVGKATVVVKGKGKYTGSKKVTFQIVPKRMTITSVKYNSKDSTYTIRWGDYTGLHTGYKVYYSTKADGKYTLLKGITKETKRFTSGALKKGKMYFFRVSAYLNINGEVYESPLSDIMYDSSAIGDDPVLIDLEGNSSVTSISFSSVDKVGKKAYLTWKTPTNKKVTSIQILRKDKNVDYYVVVAEITNLSQNMYIDTSANSNTEKYYIRCVIGKKVGEASGRAFVDNSSTIHWYKGSGNYYRVDLAEIEYYGVPMFKQYATSGMKLVWSCDWSGGLYESEAPNDKEYKYYYNPADGYYETEVTAYANVTESTFEYLWYEVEDKPYPEEDVIYMFTKKGSRVK